MSAPRFGHRPALDGVRGLAVAAVLCFHGGYGWARGGFLGVSLFFTLSGFLITTLALEEFERRGQINLVAFWGRRARRLLPAITIAIALAVALATIAGDPSIRTSLFGDVLSGLGYYANWHFVWDHNSYGSLFQSPSPLLHLWSLSVEEQFYVVFPIMAALTLRIGRWLLATIAALWVVVGGLAPIVAHFGVDRAYYGTDVRGAEIALGVVMAVVASRFVLEPSVRSARVVGTAAVVALGASVVAWVRIAQSDGALRSGGFVAYAVASSVLVLAAAMDAGPVARLCRTRILRRLGLVSYGLYLYHWPILWFLAQETDWPGWARWAVGVSVSYVLAEISLQLLELPIRQAGRRTRVEAPASSRVRARRSVVPTFRWAAAVVACLLAMGFAVGGSIVERDRSTTTDFEAAQAAFDRIGARRAAATPSATPSQTPTRTVAFFGDSTSIMTALGFDDATAAVADSRLVAVQGWGRLGCGVVVVTQRRLGSRLNQPPPGCESWMADWTAAIDASRPDIAVLQIGPWETMDSFVPELGGWTHLGEPRFDALVKEQLRRATDVLGARGARVVLLTPPSLDRAEGRDECGCSDRVRRLADLERQVAAEQPGRLSVVDLAAWHVAQGADDERLRPDGAHVTEETGAEVARRFLIPALTTIPPAAVDLSVR